MLLVVTSRSDHVKKENVEQLNKHNIITVMQDDYRPMETRRSVQYF